MQYCCDIRLTLSTEFFSYSVVFSRNKSLKSIFNRDFLSKICTSIFVSEKLSAAAAAAKIFSRTGVQLKSWQRK